MRYNSGKPGQLLRIALAHLYISLALPRGDQGFPTQLRVLFQGDHLAAGVVVAEGRPRAAAYLQELAAQRGGQFGTPFSESPQ